eukprot:scaffold79530_cov29-Tisochrysis_lutea.AAC.1
MICVNKAESPATGACLACLGITTASEKRPPYNRNAQAGQVNRAEELRRSQQMAIAHSSSTFLMFRGVPPALPQQYWLLIQCFHLRCSGDRGGHFKSSRPVCRLWCTRPLSIGVLL